MPITITAVTTTGGTGCRHREITVDFEGQVVTLTLDEDALSTWFNAEEGGWRRGYVLAGIRKAVAGGATFSGLPGTVLG